ncbi:MAG: hypothetical protein LBR87_01495 [Synergistaceae bacterium]|jgi:uncharacterized Zn finger protein|nr:hypothetical protein [Synergistaceae bacterium]
MKRGEPGAAPPGGKQKLKRGRPPGIRTCPEFDETRWWTEGFVRRISEIASPKQINAAKNYARAGRVVSLAVSPGLIEAKVQGRRRAPYCVRLHASLMSEARMEEIKRKISEKAIYRVTLLAGDIPGELSELFKSSGMPLSMASFSGRRQQCSCSEPEEICKHILAAVYVAAAAFSRDPFLLMKLRGIGRDDLLRLLCAPVGENTPAAPDPGEWDGGAPGSSAESGDGPPGGISLDSEFYGSRALADELNDLERRAPEGGALTPIPDFPLWRGETSFADSVSPYYRCVEKFVRDKQR